MFSSEQSCYPRLVISRSQDEAFPDRWTANLLSPPALKSAFHNLCSRRPIRSNAYLLTNKATKTQ